MQPCKMIAEVWLKYLRLRPQTQRTYLISRHLIKEWNTSSNRPNSSSNVRHRFTRNHDFENFLSTFSSFFNRTNILVGFLRVNCTVRWICIWHFAINERDFFWFVTVICIERYASIIKANLLDCWNFQHVTDINEIPFVD